MEKRTVQNIHTGAQKRKFRLAQLDNTLEKVIHLNLAVRKAQALMADDAPRQRCELLEAALESVDTGRPCSHRFFAKRYPS